jgi:uncharacterized Zn finger protein
MLAAAITLAPASLFAVEGKEHVEIQKEGVQLIRQLEEVARDVRYNAGRLDSFTSTTLISKWTHLHHLDQIRSLVNEGLKPALTRLVEIQGQLPDWKQRNIDAMLSSAKALAEDTNSALMEKREAGATPPILNTEYKALISKIYQHAQALVKTSDAAGNYASARLKAAEAGLKVPTT